MKSIKISKDKYLNYYNSYVQEKFKKLKYKSGFNAFISQYDEKKEKLNIIANGIHNAATQNFYLILYEIFSNATKTELNDNLSYLTYIEYTSPNYYFYSNGAASSVSLTTYLSVTDNNGIVYNSNGFTSIIANSTNLTLSLLIPANTFTGSSISSMSLNMSGNDMNITLSNITPPTNTINPALATTINLVFSDML